MNENVTVLNTFGSLTTTDSSMYKMDIQTSCIFVLPFQACSYTTEGYVYLGINEAIKRGVHPYPNRI